MIKIVAIAIICSILILYLRSTGSEYTTVCIVGAGVLIISYALTYITEIFEFINKIASLSGIDSNFFKIIYKITAIGYLIEFSSGILEDVGLQSLSKKLIFTGKIIILSISLPVLYAVFNLITGLIKWKYKKYYLIL